MSPSTSILITTISLVIDALCTKVCIDKGHPYWGAANAAMFGANLVYLIGKLG